MLHTVPQSLCNLVNLTQLYLRNNQIGDEDFPKDMRSLMNLRDLNLSGNRMRTLPQSLFHLESKYIRGHSTTTCKEFCPFLTPTLRGRKTTFFDLPPLLILST